MVRRGGKGKKGGWGSNRLKKQGEPQEGLFSGIRGKREGKETVKVVWRGNRREGEERVGGEGMIFFIKKSTQH